MSAGTGKFDTKRLGKSKVKKFLYTGNNFHLRVETEFRQNIDCFQTSVEMNLIDRFQQAPVKDSL